MIKADIIQIIEPYKTILGKNYTPYMHHVQRVFLLTIAHKQKIKEEDEEKIMIAAVFHDIGIWTEKTFDYLDPSINEAKKYLQNINKMEWLEEITLIIHMHHKQSEYQGKFKDNVESFRKADLVDLLKGLKLFGLSKQLIRDNYKNFPGEGFQKILIILFLKRLVNFPFNPLPMLKK